MSTMLEVESWNQDGQEMRACEEDRVKSPQEPMTLLEEPQNGADSTTEERTGSGASIKYVLTMLRVMGKAFMNECLAAERTSEKVVKRVVGR